ncbi:MAG: hypothetical protein NZ805_08520 [Armatimonadetes bacterium]|nr:hypothetical protein [Armatimonadota bacterium]
MLLVKGLVVTAILGLSLLLGFKQQASEEKVLTYTTHWVGNTFEGAGPNGYGRWVQNFVDEIEVTFDGAVITASLWDEAGRCTGIYKDGDVNADLLKQYQGRGGHKAWGWGTASQAVAVEGNFIFIANTANELLRFRWNPKNIHQYAYIDQTNIGGDEKDNAVAMSARSGLLYIVRKSGEVQVRRTHDLSLVRTFKIEGAQDIAVAHDGTLWVVVGNRIERYSGEGKKLVGTVAGVEKPVAIAIGNDKEQLIVCDDGTRQQVLFYDISNPKRPKLVRAFGENGGLRSGVPGEVKPLKFFALRGAGTDGQGNIYVAMGLTMGETVIRKFAPTGKLVWEVTCLAFVDCFDVLEVEPGKFEIYGQAEIIGFDPTKPPGKSWWLKAITRDHVRYPDDPRNKELWGGALVRVLRGRRVLFTTPQMGGGFRIFVFEPPPSQIARFAGEITLPNVELWARNVDSKGDIWFSDGSKIVRYRFKGFDAKGNPVYDLDNPETWRAPEPFTQIMRLKYIPETDTLYIGGYTPEVQPPSWGLMGGVLARYDDWAKGNRKARYAILMPRDDDNLFPKEFDVAGDYIFAVMVKTTKGIPAMVHVYRADTGEKVGVMFPGQEVGGNSGWIDMVHGIHALKTSSGDYLVVVEEDWRGKNLVYHWRPKAR